MGKSKAPKGATSNISSSANPATSSITQSTTKSSILRSSFSPSALQLSLFASVIQGLDSQHLRVHDTTSGRLRCEHAIASRASITSLDWGYCGRSYRGKQDEGSKKKRKRVDLANGDTSTPSDDDATIAFGTSDSKVHIFSPTESKVLRVLSGAHTHGIRDFKFKDRGLQAEGWSVGGDAKLVEWDLRKGTAIRTVTLPHGPVNTLRPLSSRVICGSQNAYILDPNAPGKISTFAASTNNIHSILHSTTDSSQVMRFLTIAETDRYMNVFSEDSPTLIGSLRTENEVLGFDYTTITSKSQSARVSEGTTLGQLGPRDYLLAVNKDGAVEIFPEPFNLGSGTSREEVKSMKARMQKRSRPRAALVSLKRPDKISSVVPVVNASFQDTFIVMACVEGGINPVFEKIGWQDEEHGTFLLKNVTEVFKAKTHPGIEAEVVNGVKDMGKNYVDESHAIIINGGDLDDASMAEEAQEVIEISSAEDSELEDEVPLEFLENGKTGMSGDNQAEQEDVDMDEAEAPERVDQGSEAAQDDQDPAQEPSFGELIRANTSETVDVQASFVDPNAQTLVPGGDRSLQQLPSGMSLGTVLTQSLRTNDTSLLETCFHVRDFAIVRATIERLDSSFATILLQRLAERLHSRPGRAGSLMVWIQWTLVAHGGYLAGQPETMKKLASLHRVVKDRANSLQSLLALKGKLDMLEAQMNLRKSMQARSRAANMLGDDDEQDVIYVEGQEESESESDEGQDGKPASPQSKSLKGAPNSHDPEADIDMESNASDVDDDEEDSDEEKPMTNGVAAHSEDEDSDSDSDQALLDEEAESTDQDSGDEASEDEIDHESVDSVDSSDGDASPPPKRPAKSKLGNGFVSQQR